MKLASNIQQQRVDTALLPALQKSNDSLGLSNTLKKLIENSSALLHAATPMGSSKMQPNIEKILLNAFDGQRKALQKQASSSKDLTLTALACLRKRHFQPALGGLEIPLSGMALGGRSSARSKTKAKLQELTEGLHNIENEIGQQTWTVAVIQEEMSHLQPNSDEYGDLTTELTEQQTRLDALHRQSAGIREQIARL